LLNPQKLMWSSLHPGFSEIFALLTPSVRIFLVVCVPCKLFDSLSLLVWSEGPNKETNRAPLVRARLTSCSPHRSSLCSNGDRPFVYVNTWFSSLNLKTSEDRWFFVSVLGPLLFLTCFRTGDSLFDGFATVAPFLRAFCVLC